MVGLLIARTEAPRVEPRSLLTPDRRHYGDHCDYGLPQTAADCANWRAIAASGSSQGIDEARADPRNGTWPIAITRAGTLSSAQGGGGSRAADPNSDPACIRRAKRCRAPWPEERIASSCTNACSARRRGH